MTSSAPAESRPRPGAHDLVWPGLLLVVLALLCAYDPFLNHDVALYLSAARELLHGAVPGRDFVDVNPPLIVYLSVAPALLLRVGVSPVQAIQLSLVVLLLASSIVLGRLLARPPFAFARRERALLACFWLLATIEVYLLNDFGQREQLFVLLSAPFLVLRAARHTGEGSGTRLAVLLGVGAALGSCLKPSFLAIVVVVEGVALASSRRTRTLLAPEMAAFGLTASAYAASFVAIAPLADAVRTWGPLVLRAYGVYDSPLPALQPWQPLLLSGLVMSVLAASLAKQGPPGRLLVTAGLVHVLSLASYVAQGKGWSYHLIPGWYATAALAGLLTLTIIRHCEDSRAGRATTRVMAALLAFALLRNPSLPARIAADPVPEPRSEVGELLERYTVGDERVLALDTTVGATYPALTLSGRRPASRFSCAWPLPMLFRNARGDADPPESALLEARFRQALADDVAAWRPRLVLVNTRRPCWACPPDFTVDGYLRERGVYDTILAGYEAVPGTAGFKALRRTGS